MDEETYTRYIIDALGADNVAYLTSIDSKTVQRWYDGGLQPDIDQLETLVFTATIFQRLMESMDSEGADIAFNIAAAWIMWPQHADHIRDGLFNEVSRDVRIWIEDHKD